MIRYKNKELQNLSAYISIMKNKTTFRKRLIPKSLLIQYLISYIIILAIPLIFFSAFIHYRFRSALIAEIQENNRFSVSNYVIREEKNMEKIQNMVNSIMVQEEFRPFSSPADYENAHGMIEMLETYTGGSDFPLIAVYWDDSAYLYSNVGTCTIDALPDQFIQQISEHPQENHIFLSQLSPLTRKEGSYIVYSIPISNQVHGTTQYLLFVQTVAQFLESISYPADVSEDLYIYTEDHTFLYGNPDIFSSLIPTEASFPLSPDGKHMVHLAHAPAAGLTFASAVPLTSALATANRLQAETIFCITAILILSGLLISLMVHFNYSPIQQLLHSVEHLFKTQQKGNELQTIQQAFETLESQKDQIIQNTRKASLDYYIRSLLKGRAIPGHDSDSLSVFLPSFTHEHFSVCVLTIEQDQLPSEKIRAEIQSLFSPYCLCYLVEGSQKYSFSVLLNFDNNEGEFFEILNQVRALAEQQFECPVTLACGGICHDLKELPQLFTKAIYTMDYSYIKGTNCVILSEETLSQDEFDTSYPYVELQNLQKQLKRRNSQAISLQMDSILEYITTSGVPLFVARRISYDIVNMVLTSLNDEELNHNQSYINSLTRFHSVQELAAAVYNIYQNLVVIPENNTAPAVDTVSEMKSYVQEHFTNPDFSLQNMAEYFEMSMTGLSQYFKTKCGQTLIDYYSELRIELAKQLLLEHKFKVDEVASMTGYNNTSSFMRRFKQLTGMTPGQYASQNNGT